MDYAAHVERMKKLTVPVETVAVTCLLYTSRCVYETVSHVGIYVGDNVMLHCGDPIQYTSINSSYWQSHFYAFGRPNY